MHVIYRGIMMLIIAGALGGASEVMAGAYDTGEGHGFDSCASTEIVYAGTIIRFTRIPPNIRLMLYDEIDHLRCAALFQCGPCLPCNYIPMRLAIGPTWRKRCPDHAVSVGIGTAGLCFV